MPSYVIVTGATAGGRPLEGVGAGFNRQLIGTMLRGRERYRGLVLSDWAITNDCDAACRTPTAAAPQRPQDIGMPWGVEALTREQRFAKAVNAGVDQFGGVDDPAPLLAAVRHGSVARSRIDAAVRRILLIKFELGLFDDPFVDPAAAARLAADPAIRGEAEAAQRAAIVLLVDRRVLPVATGRRVWLFGVEAQAARSVGLVPVATPEEAEIAIVRTATPSEKLHPDHFFGQRQNEGRLDFRAGDPGYDAFRRAAAKVPTVLAIDMDRPAIVANVKDRAAALLAVFGASDAALLDVVAGRAHARGRLPFELPSSMAAVAAQDPARPDDSPAPDFPAGAGIVR